MGRNQVSNDCSLSSWVRTVVRTCSQSLGVASDCVGGAILRSLQARVGSFSTTLARAPDTVSTHERPLWNEVNVENRTPSYQHPFGFYELHAVKPVESGIASFRPQDIHGIPCGASKEAMEKHSDAVNRSYNPLFENDLRGRCTAVTAANPGVPARGR